MSDWSYLFTPFLAWLVAGTCKFVINSFRLRRWALAEIGYGGLPSNHSAIVSSTAALIALREGPTHPSFGVAVTLAFIVMIDAQSLRRQIGKQAAAINRLARDLPGHQELREKMGHTRVEIVAGLLVGVLVALAVNSLPW